MPELSRRVFLIRGSMGAALVGVAAAIPGLNSVVTTAEADAPAADDAATSAATESAGPMTDPIIAHVKDLQTGEMSLYMGEREFTMRDPGLAARLFGGAK